MATINYTREWQRISDRLDWLHIKLTKQLGLAETDEERHAIHARIEQVQAQIYTARAAITRLQTKEKAARYVD